ncbi:MAG TPA: mercury(II) reductase [Caldilineaceae bacterium]|nr:mercury(II) reductase [Caldilineaceae bacterium]
MKAYDLVILGSGSTAFAAALKAAELGKRAVMTEVRTLGGTCVNRGCLPSKNLIEAAKLLHEARHPRYPGIAPYEPQFDFGQLIAQKDEVIASYRDQKYQSIIGESQEIDVVYGRARLADPYTVEVSGPEGVTQLRGDKILLALGSSPTLPPIEGLAATPHLTSDLLTSEEDMELKELPSSLIIVGGGYIALELGQMFARFGAQVTILERNRRLLYHGYEPEVGLAIQRILRDEGINVQTRAEVVRVAGDAHEVKVTARVNGHEQEFRAVRLLVATGRQPNTHDVGLEAAGVELTDGSAVKVDTYLRTSLPHIFAAGDMIGAQFGNQFATPVGAHDGVLAAHNAFAEETGRPLRQVDHRVIPRTIFTDPQIGLVGLTEEEGIAAGHRCWCNTIPMALVPRAGAIRDTRGIIKMVADADSGEVLGVSMVGVNAGEVIHEAAMALRFRATLDDFIDLIHVYPTMAEALKIVAISRYKDPAKLSCCAE